MAFIDHFLTQVFTDNGTVVWVRGVPPYTLKDVYLEYPSPTPPIVTLESDAGSERKMALPGSPEYMAYQDAMKIWRVDVNRGLIDHHIDYGIVKWKFPWDEKELEPWTDAPDDWGMPPRVAQYHLNPTPEEHRVLFIKNCILVTQDDIENVDVILYSIKPVEKKDIEAALVPTLSRSEEDHPNLDQ